MKPARDKKLARDLLSTVKRTAMLAEVANCVPALTPLVAKSYDTRPADVLFRMVSMETKTIACSRSAQQGDPMRPAMFCLALRPVLKRFREEFEGERSGNLRINGRYGRCLSRP